MRCFLRVGVLRTPCGEDTLIIHSFILILEFLSSSVLSSSNIERASTSS